MTILKQLTTMGIIKSFVCWNTTDFTDTLAVRETQWQAPPHAFLGDVKNMFTNICHRKMRSVIAWILSLANQHIPCETWFAPRAKSTAPVLLHVPHKRGKYIPVTLALLQQMLYFDLENVFFMVGCTILQQVLGIPMGSPCSPALAIALCMHAEHSYLVQPGIPRMLGFRYVDDVLVFLEKAEHAIALPSIYPAPLELEVEAHSGTFRFLESWVTLTPHNINVEYYHKNTYRQRAGLHALKNVVHFSTCQPKHVMFGLAVGTLTRVARHCLGQDALHRGVSRTITQFLSLGASPALLYKALHRMSINTRDPIWLTFTSLY